MTATRKIFVNLPVRNLDATVGFFTKLGFTFNPQFTDDKATCMIISEEAFVMLLVDGRFADFTKRAVADASSPTEAILALSADSRAAVDLMADTALANGGKPAMDAMDLGFMYSRSFYDIDGHHWEVLYMDMAAVPPQP